jgi:hypothetical protein
MAVSQYRSILVYEMVIGAYIERHSFPYSRDWPCAIECLGNGWPPLATLLLFIPQKVTPPSSSPNLPLRSAGARHVTSGAQRLARIDEPRRESGGG